MLKVQCELINIKKKTTDYYQKLKRDEKVNFLEASVNWLRDEAFKLSTNLDAVNASNKKFLIRMEELEKENVFLKEFMRATKRKNLTLKKTIEQLKDPENMKKYADAFMKIQNEFKDQETLDIIEEDPVSTENVNPNMKYLSKNTAVGDLSGILEFSSKQGRDSTAFESSSKS